MTDLPYILRLYVYWLLDQAAVTDEVGRNIVTDLSLNADGDPVILTTPWIEVLAFPGRIVSGGSIYWLEETLLQVNCFAQKRHATHELAELVRSTTVDRFQGVVTAGVDEAAVTGTRPGGIRDDYDTRFAGKTVHRSRFDVMVTAHPVVATAS